jgi:hypothetical protein
MKPCQTRRDVNWSHSQKESTAMILVAFLFFAILLVAWMIAPNGTSTAPAPAPSGKLPLAEPASA